jgi:hypothetical protein
VPTTSRPSPSAAASSAASTSASSPANSPSSTTTYPTSPQGSGADPAIASSAGVTSTARSTTIGATSCGGYLATSNLSNAVVNGDLYVAPNVTVSNVMVNGELLPGRKPCGGSYNSNSPSNIRIEHVQFRSMFTIGFDGLTLDAVRSVGQPDSPDAQIYDYTGNPARNLVIQNSYFGPPPNNTNDSAHIEAIHLGGVKNVVFRNNIFDYRTSDSTTLYNQTTVLSLGASEITGSFAESVVVDHNTLFGGGYYSSYLSFDTRSRPSAVTNNAVSSAGDPIWAGVQYPPSAYNKAGLPGGAYQRFTASGNVLNGKPVTFPGQS